MDRRTGLWRNPGFLRLWGGWTVSTLGSQVTQVALPLTAVLVLQATPLSEPLIASLVLPAVLGTIIAAGGAGGLLGAVAAGRVARHLGTGRALLGAMLVATAGELLIAFAGVPVGLAAALLLVAELLVGLGAAVFGVNYLTLRQLVTPAPMQGRVHATSRAVVSGLGPLGALAGGVLGQAAGLRAPLIVGALGTLSAAALLLASPVRSSGPHSAPAMTKLT